MFLYFCDLWKKQGSQQQSWITGHPLFPGHTSLHADHIPDPFLPTVLSPAHMDYVPPWYSRHLELNCTFPQSQFNYNCQHTCLSPSALHLGVLRAESCSPSPEHKVRSSVNMYCVERSLATSGIEEEATFQVKQFRIVSHELKGQKEESLHIKPINQSFLKFHSRLLKFS